MDSIKGMQLLATAQPRIFMIHDFEEIVMFKSWSTRNRAELRKRFPKLEKYLYQKKVFNLSTSAFAIAVLHELLLISTVSFISLWSDRYDWWFLVFSAYSLHLFVHIGQWLVCRKYVPMIITTILTFPHCLYTFYCFNQVLQMDYSTMPL